MGCKINSSKPPIFSKAPTKTPIISSSFSIQPKHKTNSITSSYNLSSEQPISTVSQGRKELRVYNVKFQTLAACKLGISRYPDFDYNAQGGSGTATGTKNGVDLADKITVSFDLQSLYIPPLSSATTRFLGLLLPPFLKIDIVPELFQGTIVEETGQVDLQFKAKFLFSVGKIYKAPPLLVATVLTSEESNGVMKGGRGERLDGDGNCRLVGVATVDPIDDILINSFLGLPTECLADLNANISISTASS